MNTNSWGTLFNPLEAFRMIIYKKPKRKIVIESYTNE